ncbi:MAG: DUF2231 domain-containing protein [Bacteroidota bacterium]
MEFIPEWAPNLHPMVVHFPIGIVALALLMDLINLLLPKNNTWWNEISTLVLYVIGTLTAVGVYFTGTSAADSVFLPAEAQSLLNAHADWALWTVWFLGIYTTARTFVFWKIEIRRRSVLHILFFTISLIGMVFLYQTGDRGAEMVFRHGVGVQTEESFDTSEESESSSEAEQQFTVSENGDWSWEIADESTQILREEFHFLIGDLEQLSAETITVDGETEVLQFYGDDLEAFFVTHDTYQNVQTDYYLDFSKFEGSVTLANHVRDAENYDFVRISSDGSVTQGRVSDGETEIFDEGETDVSGSLFIRVVGNGTHFRGYVDKEMIVHGHGDAPETGHVGMKLEGSGILHLEQIEMVQLDEE